MPAWGCFFGGQHSIKKLNHLGELNSGKIHIKKVLATSFYKAEPCFEAQTSLLQSRCFLPPFKKYIEIWPVLNTWKENFKLMSAYSGKNLSRTCFALHSSQCCAQNCTCCRPQSDWGCCTSLDHVCVIPTERRSVLYPSWFLHITGLHNICYSLPMAKGKRLDQDDVNQTPN